MSVLDKFGISDFSDKELQELTASKIFFETLEISDDKRINKVSRKKAIIDDLFCLFSEHFKLNDIKITFSTCEEENESFICIDNLNVTYLSLVENLLRKCIEKYFTCIDEMENISDNQYRLIKLSVINNDQELIKIMTNEIINKLFVNTEYEYNFPVSKLSKSRITQLINDNTTRNKKILEICNKYSVCQDLLPGQIRAVFTCLSSEIFNNISVKEKIHLMNLVYNYFTYNKDDRFNKYKKVVNSKFTNIDALNYVLYDLSIKDGNNYLNKFRNEKLFEDVKSGFKYIIKNETIKDNVKKLDLVSMKSIYKK